MQYQEQVLFSLPLPKLEPIFKQWVKDVLTENNSTETPPKTDNQSATEEGPVTRDKLATILSVSLVTLNTWEKQGLIKGHMLGGRKYFYLSEINESLKGRNQKKKEGQLIWKNIFKPPHPPELCRL